MFLRKIITCTQMLFCLISVVLNAEKQDLPEALKKMNDIKLEIELSNKGKIIGTSTFNNCNFGNIRLDSNFENPVRLFKHSNQSKRRMKTTFKSSTSSSDIGDKKDDMTTIPQKKEEGASKDGLKEDSFDRKTSPLSSKDRAAKDEKHDDDSQSPYKSVFLIQRNSPAIPSLFLDCILRRYGMDSPSNQEKVTTENSNKNPQTSEATDKKEKADEKEQKELFTSDIKKRYTSSESSSSDSFSDKLSDLIQNISSSKNSKNLGEDSQENLISKETESSNLNTLSKENGDVNQKNSENSEVKHDPESTVTTLA